jgi:A/G-specific adenine glycosylase
VLAWWRRSAVRRERDLLPWRRSPAGGRPDPWAVLVSEVMLAQTQLTRVAARYSSFVARFPDPAHLASARLGEVLELWDGLGYPRRAVALRRAAAIVAAQHEGRVPRDLPALLALPGVGAYTARAVMAFGYDLPAMPIDTNVGRVLARALAGARLGPSAARSLGDSLLGSAPRSGRARALAVMDLGAVLCTARSPRCGRCPLSGPRSGRPPLCRYAAAAAEGPVADPASGSWAVSRPQARFQGSDREARGRLLRAAARGPLAPDELPAAAGCPADPGRAVRVAESLVTDGLLVRTVIGCYCIAS